MKALDITAVIHVSELQCAANYYKDVLGFKVDFEFGEYIGLVYGDVSIHLSGPASRGVKKIPR
jgi:hypothetical protein